MTSVVADRTYTIEYRDPRAGGSWLKWRNIEAQPSDRSVNVDYTFTDPTSAYLFRVVTPGR